MRYNDTIQYVPQMPINAVALDQDLSIAVGSKEFCRLMGWDSIEYSIQITNYQLPNPTDAFAEKFCALDRLAFESMEKLVAVEIFPTIAGMSGYITERNPLFDDDGNICGILWTTTDITHTSLYRYFYSLSIIDNNILGEKLNGGSYILRDDSLNLPFSPRQQECLFFSLRGKSAKEISMLLGVSTRTIESHLTLVKAALGCSRRSELIETATKLGYWFHIPASLRDKPEILGNMDCIFSERV